MSLLAIWVQYLSLLLKRLDRSSIVKTVTQYHFSVIFTSTINNAPPFVYSCFKPFNELKCSIAPTKKHTTSRTWASHFLLYSKTSTSLVNISRLEFRSNLFERSCCACFCCCSQAQVTGGKRGHLFQSIRSRMT